MPTKAIWKQLMKNSTLRTVHSSYARLKEHQNTGRAQTLVQVDLHDLEDDTVVFSLELPRRTHFAPLLASGDSQKRCDYVVICTRQGTTYVIFVEMKSTNRKKGLVRKLLRSTECFVDYCDSVGRRFHDRSLLDSVEKRFVVIFRGASLNKKPTRPPAATNSDHSSQDPLFLPVGRSRAHVYLRQII